MPSREPLEIRLIKAMKKAGFVTKGSVASIVKQEITNSNLATQDDIRNLATKKEVDEIVHTQLTEYHHNMAKPEFMKIHKQVDGLKSKLVKLEYKVDKNTVQIEKLEDQFDGLKADMAMSASKLRN